MPGFQVSQVHDRLPGLPPPPTLFAPPAQLAAGGSPRGSAAPPAAAKDLMRFAFCSACHEENLAHFDFCFRCGVPSNGALPTPRYPQQVPLVVAQVQARRAQALAAMAGRPEQVRKSRVADEFDAFALVASVGCRGWQTATPDDVFDFHCFLDTRKRYEDGA